MITLTLIPRYKFASLTIGNAPTVTYGYEEIEVALMWVIDKVKTYGLRVDTFEPTKRYRWVGDEENVAYAQPVVRYQSAKTILPKKVTVINLFDNQPAKPKVGRPLGKLTTKQARYLEWIDSYIREHDEAPTFEELAEQFNVRYDTAYKLVSRLCDNGWLTFTRFSERSIRVVKLPERTAS